MADGYLEKRYEEVFGKGAKKTVVKHTSIETLMEKNRSYRGYDQSFEVKRDMLERIVAVNTKIASAKNQQVLRFKLVTKETGAKIITQNMKLGGLLPELHLPYPGTEPEAFIIICSTCNILVVGSICCVGIKEKIGLPFVEKCNKGSHFRSVKFCVIAIQVQPLRVHTPSHLFRSVLVDAVVR